MKGVGHYGMPIANILLIKVINGQKVKNQPIVIAYNVFR
jgi:hypothetical protein